MLHRKSLWLLCMVGFFLLATTPYAQAQRWNPSHAIGTVSGKYAYQYGQIPDQLVEIYPAAFTSSGLTYQWQKSFTAADEGFSDIPNASGINYTPVDQLLQTTYYRRKTTQSPTGTSIVSNIIKLSVVSVNWEDRNYIREHDVSVPGITTWQAVDQLPVGNKMQTTTYMDGLGRSVEKVSRETATPSQAGGLWGDVVQFSQYDEWGQEPKKYLPYTTTTESGKFKSSPGTDQTQYYSNVYNETSAYSSITLDNSPLNRVTNVKSSGTAWAAGKGDDGIYEVNNADDSVQIFTVDYVQGNPPVTTGVYAANTLYKIITKDENNTQVISYVNKAGQQILKKVQIDSAPATGHAGWICTYSVYDDLGLLRYQLQPEAVKYLAANNWSFAGTNGTQVLNELCYQYYYDDKGRTTWKKVPGAAPLYVLYDLRDRTVFTQDGNQRDKSPGEWTANLYDELDRNILTGLYSTTKATTDLQTDINNAALTNPISDADINDPSKFTALAYNYYDNYNFTGVKPFDNNFTNNVAYSSSSTVDPIAKSDRTIGFSTGSKERVLGSNTFLLSTMYYDDKGRLIQTSEDNIKAGTDITTIQYHFDDRILSSDSKHTTSAEAAAFDILTKYEYDRIGRAISLEKKFGDNDFKTIATDDYDDVGHIKTTHLAPGYTSPLGIGPGNELENLNYSYNIHNQITGINKDYALKNSGTYNKWGHFFGMYLGYDNRDNVFSKAQLNGQVTGVLWNTQGDDAQRKYDYTYDNANRLINAAFTEQKHVGDGWSNSKMDFSVTGISYDFNGNLLNMLQKGVVPGTTAPIDVDNLSYTYALYSNKLQSVTDRMTLTNVNGTLGDFKDGSNGTSPDYVYDDNGNLVIDLNKNAKDLENVVGANGISYNYLDKPEKIRIAGKGTIRIVYSASGEKLQRAFIPESGDTATITTYINQFAYQDKVAITTTAQPPFAATTANLSYVNFEEGRLRIIQPVAQDNGLDGLQIAGNISLPNGKTGVFDYFIKDYQENTRMVLTEEIHSAYNTSTMETNRAAAEAPVFGQTGAANEVESTRYPAPSDWQDATIGSSVSRLGNIAGHNIGPNTLQKVMAGDQVSATAQYYYRTATGGSNPNFVSTFLTSLAQSITGGGAATSLVKANAGNITSQLNGTNGFINAIQPTSSGNNTPQAYLTILFFDERFNFIEAADGGVAQQQVGSISSPLGLNIRAPKNGYVYAYVSNQSDQDVYFDNLKVGIARGHIIEENHYYAYGLRIAAISSRKPADVNEGKLKNDYLYNDKELFDDADLDWYDYGFRNYDPQIGRFVQIDPLTDDYPFLTPYLYAGCDPINKVDVDGLFGGIATTAEAAKDMATVYVVASKATTTTVSLTKVALSVTSIAIHVTMATANVLNSSFNTNSVGENINNGGGTPKQTGTGGKPAPKVGVGIDENSGFWSNMLEKQMRGWWLAWKLTKEAGQKAWNNAKNNIASGHSIPQRMYADFKANPMSFLDGGEEVELMRMALGLKETATATEVLTTMDEIGQESGILRDAARGKGNFGLGEATAATSDKLGKAWVGEGYRVASDGRTLVSSNGLRQYRPPSAKNSKYATTGIQSNFEWRNPWQTEWQGNGHLNIIK